MLLLHKWENFLFKALYIVSACLGRPTPRCSALDWPKETTSSVYAWEGLRPASQCPRRAEENYIVSVSLGRPVPRCCVLDGLKGTTRSQWHAAWCIDWYKRYYICVNTAISAEGKSWQRSRYHYPTRTWWTRVREFTHTRCVLRYHIATRIILNCIHIYIYIYIYTAGATIGLAYWHDNNQ